MRETIDFNPGKRSQEDIKFFNALIERYKEYNLRQTTEYIILPIPKKQKEIVLMKWRELPIEKNGKASTIGIEDHIKEIIAEEQL